MAGHGAPRYNTFDIPELQMLAHFPGDANNLNLHHRIFWYRVEQARWVVTTPDGQTYVEDFRGMNVTSPSRKSPLPPAHVAEIYAFDTADAVANYAAWKTEAQNLAFVMGCQDNPGVPAVGAAAAPSGDWRISDVDSDRFRDIVPSGEF